MKDYKEGEGQVKISRCQDEDKNTGNQTNQGLKKTDVGNMYNYNSINDLFNFIAEGKYNNKDSKKQKNKEKKYFVVNNEYTVNIKKNEEQCKNMNDDCASFKKEIEKSSIQNNVLFFKIKPVISTNWLEEINRLFVSG